MYYVVLVSSDSTFTAWQKDSSGNMKRTLNYTITINNPLIGKFSAATEYQVRFFTCGSDTLMPMTFSSDSQCSVCPH